MSIFESITFIELLVQLFEIDITDDCTLKF